MKQALKCLLHRLLCMCLAHAQYILWSAYRAPHQCYCYGYSHSVPCMVILMANHSQCPHPTFFFITPISLITYGHFIRKTTMSSSTPADCWCTVTSTCLSLSFKETSQLCSVFPPQWTLILEFRHTSLWGSSRCFFRVSHQSLPTLSPKKAFFWWVFFRKQNKIW